MKQSISRFLHTCAHFAVSAFAGLVLSGCGQDDQSEWTELFNGETLEGWTQKGGQAEYHVEGDAIVGTSVLNTPNSFLTTNEHYEDFILEFEFKVETGLNSGVQFRSLSLPEYKNGRVHGYQYELDTSDRAWTAGIYDEARRGWLYPVDLNPAAKAAFRPDQWNTARIECHGKLTRTFLNGHAVSYLVDEETFVRSGFIGLQVHSISAESGAEGKQVRWRNLRTAKATDDNLTKGTPDFPIKTL